MKKTAALICALLLMFGMLPAAGAVDRAGIRFYDEANGLYGPVTQASLVSVVLDGEELTLDVPAVTRSDRTMVPVAPIALALGAQVLWVEENRQVILFQGEDTIVLTLGSPVATVNGELVPLPDGVSADIAEYGGVERTMVPLLFVSQQLHASVGWDGDTYTVMVDTAPAPEETPEPETTPGPEATPEPEVTAAPEDPAEPETPPASEVTPPPEIQKTLTGYTVTLDAGHGGWSSGAVYEDIMEKDIDLAVALRAERILKEMGCEVYMIRTDDTFVDIHDRASMANKKDTDIFVSVHSNAFPSNANIHGTLTYYCPGSSRGKTLAQCLQTAVSASAGSQDRGIAQDELVVVKETSMPAALVELGFMTNHEELMKLADPVYQEKLAQGIAAGIEDYLLNKR